MSGGSVALSEGQAGPDARAAALAAAESKLSRCELDPLLHAAEAEAIVVAGAVEAAAVVLDRDDEGVAALGQRHRHQLGVGVLDDVGERLLHEPVDRRLELGS